MATQIQKRGMAGSRHAVHSRGCVLDDTGVKAWRLGAEGAEYNALVYAETRNRARAINADGFEYYSYLEITAAREPQADQYYDGQSVEYRSAVHYEIGWWNDEGSTACEVCERYPYDNIEGSEVCAECFHCAKCGCEDGCPGVQTDE